jgi:MoxR-like ATPase
MRQTITNYIRAGYAGLYLVSSEEQRVCAELKALAKEIQFHLYSWSTTEGIIDMESGRAQQAADPIEVLLAMEDLPENSLLVLRDFHLFLADPNPVLLRQLRDILHVCKAKSKTLIILGCRLCLPPEIERELAIVEFALPGCAELAVMLDGIVSSAHLQPATEHDRDAVLDAARGMTTIEAENAFALSVVEAGKVCPMIVAREKANELKKNGLLEICDAVPCLDEIGGLDQLKRWLIERKDAFSKGAQEYGLPAPKGLLIIGVPGTGKSLTAKATAAVFQRPLLKLDAGRIFGSLVGQSEGNLRSVLQTVQAIAPCVLWIDEIEKGFGSANSGASDGGTTTRVLGTLLSWLQDRKAPVFVVATANQVRHLPPELLRKGRFDELFFVDLPNHAEREAIWRIQIAKYGRKPEQFEVFHLAKATEGFTGAEIEQVFIDAMYAGFSSRSEPTDVLLATLLVDYTPLAATMSEEIKALRAWAHGRVKTATGQIKSSTQRKISVGAN